MDRKVIVSQVFVFVLVLVILVWSLVGFVLTANQYDDEKVEERTKRVLYVTDTAKQLAWGFLALTICLFASVGWLIVSLSRGR